MSAGKAARAKGHRAEKDVARWFRERGYTDACTTRSKLGHDGSRQPGDVDVCDGTGLVVEVKDVGRSSWPSFISQAREQASGRPWLAVRKVRGVGDPGRWVAAVPMYGDAAQHLPERPAMAVSLVASPTRWLLADRFAAWQPESVIFCTLADAEALHRASFSSAASGTTEET